MQLDGLVVQLFGAPACCQTPASQRRGARHEVRSCQAPYPDGQTRDARLCPGVEISRISPTKRLSLWVAYIKQEARLQCNRVGCDTCTVYRASRVLHGAADTTTKLATPSAKASASAPSLKKRGDPSCPSLPFLLLPMHPHWHLRLRQIPCHHCVEHRIHSCSAMRRAAPHHAEHQINSRCFAMRRAVFAVHCASLRCLPLPSAALHCIKPRCVALHPERKPRSSYQGGPGFAMLPMKAASRSE